MKKLLLIVVALVPFIANAGFYAEPYIGYGIGDYEEAGDSYNQNGSVMGARLGGSFLGVIGGFEYSKSSMEIDAVLTTVDYDITDMGVFVGYQFPSVVPFLGKVWGSYFFNSEAEGTNKVEGTGMALGIGLAPIPVPLPFLSLHFNLEYRTHDWNENNADASDSEFLLSVSLPINI